GGGAEQGQEGQEGGGGRRQAQAAAARLPQDDGDLQGHPRAEDPGRAAGLRALRGEAQPHAVPRLLHDHQEAHRPAHHPRPREEGRVQEPGGLRGGLAAALRQRAHVQRGGVHRVRGRQHHGPPLPGGLRGAQGLVRGHGGRRRVARVGRRDARLEPKEEEGRRGGRLCGQASGGGGGGAGGGAGVLIGAPPVGRSLCRCCVVPYYYCLPF
ncbi:unnamed protein product, partial [Heterosigma akashiwo]